MLKRSFSINVCLSLIIISAIYLIYTIINYPLVGLKLTPLKGNLCTVSDIYPYGWASYNDIQNKDLIYCSSQEASTFKLEKVHQLFIYSNGHEKVQKLISYDGMPLSYIIYSFLPILYFFISFSIALYLFKKKKNQKNHVISALLLLFISLAYLGSGVSAREDVFGLFITVVSMYLSPILLLDYLNTMIPKKYSHVTPRIIKWLYVFTVLLASVNTLFGTTEIILGFFIILVLLVLFFFTKRYQTIKKSIYFIKMKWFLWTIIFSMQPYILLTAIPEIFLGKQLILAENTALFLLFIPLILVYITVKNVFFDFYFFIKKLRVNFALAFVSGVLLAVFLYFNGKSSVYIFSFFLYAMIVIMIILFIKDYVFSCIAKERGKYHSSLVKFSQYTNQFHDAQSLFSYINQIISDVLQVEEVKKVQYHVNHKYFYSESLIEDPSLLSLQKSQWNIGDLQEIPTGYVLLVGKSSKIYTFILLPYKKQMTKLNHEEKEWLKSIAHYINIMLENFKKTNDLLNEIQTIKKKNQSSTVSRILFLLEEKEKVKFAQDFLDSILQELIVFHKKIVDIQNSENIESIEEIRLEVCKQMDFIRTTLLKIRNDANK